MEAAKEELLQAAQERWNCPIEDYELYLSCDEQGNKLVNLDVYYIQERPEPIDAPYTDIFTKQIS